MNIRSRRRRKKGIRKTCSQKMIKSYIRKSPFVNKGEKIISKSDIDKFREDLLKYARMKWTFDGVRQLKQIHVTGQCLN